MPVLRTTRRRLLAVVAGTLSSVLLAAGCGGTSQLTGSASPAPGGAAVYAIDTPLISLDPNTASAAQDARAMRQLYDSLVSLDRDRQPVPWLARRWKVSDDGLTYTFTLRDDVAFHDGTRFDAAAVCFNLDRIKNPKSASIYAIGLIGPYASCSAPDASTAVVHLSAPYTPLLYNLSSPFLGMVSPKAAGSVAVADYALHPVGTGPFAFDSYLPNNRLVMKRNPDYAWAPETAGRQGPAYLEQLTFQIIPDATVRVGSLRNGSVRAIGNVPETQAVTMQRDPDLTFTAVAQSGSPFQLNFNTDHPPFDDPAVRAALRQGIDVGSIVKALYFGIYQRAWGPLSPTTGSYAKEIENRYGYDPAAAKTALDAAGWRPGPDGIRVKDGRRLTVAYLEAAPNREKRQDVAQFVASALKSLGVEVDVQIQQTAELQSSLQKGSYDLVGLSLVGVDPNVMFSLYSPQFRPSPGRTGFDFTRVDDKGLTATLLRAQRATDRAARDKLYARAQQTVVDQALTIPVYVPTYTVATRGLPGLAFDAEGYPVFYTAYLGTSA